MSEIATTSPRAPALNLTRLLGRDVDWDTPYAKALGLLLVTAQAIVVVLLAWRFRLEDARFQVVLQVSVAGFLIHHFLPLRWRMPFFLTLSLGTIAYFLGLSQGPWQLTQSVERTGVLLVIGLGLIGICHLPLAFGLRVGLLLLAGVGLAVLRGGWMKFGPLDAIWPILGAMFMFRLIVYIYELEDVKGPTQLSRSLSYFFLFPNVWLYVAPVIDYETFCRTHFNDRPLAIYQKGVEWMMRGVIQLLLWRLVYYQFYLDPTRVTDGTTLIQYMVSNVALYLRVSGQFHIVIGLLHLFGFNLPETNRRYFLASSFTDYWRRVNIYWKDFMMAFYYQMVVSLKSLGTTGSAVAATALAFVATWLLHSYQWFWLRGNFPLESKDAVFWGILGLLVCLNSIREMKHGRKRTLGTTAYTLADSAGVALRTAATFLVITVLWSIWSCDSLTLWLQACSHADVKTLGWGLFVLVVIGIAAVLIEAPSRPWNTRESGKVSGGRRDAGPFPWRKAALACFLPAAVLYASSSRLATSARPDVRVVLDSLSKNTPNKTDEEYMVRGYYENLMDTSRFGAVVNAADRGQPADWKGLEETSAMRDIADLRTKELVPNQEITLNSKLFRTNSFGIRDREYDLVKPAGTYRIALLGSSLVMALNVNQDEGFEPLLEERLNREDGGKSGTRYEILNFAVNGYSPLSHVGVLRAKAFAFQPDAVILVSHPEDLRFTMKTFAATLRLGGVLRDEALQQIAARAGIDSKTPNNWAERRLIRYWPELVGWAFREVVTECRQRGITPVWVYLPGVLAQGRSETDETFVRLAREAGFVMITLFDIFPGADRSKWMVAPWDAHPNAAGHKLIADQLWGALHATNGLNIFANTVPKTERKP